MIFMDCTCRLEEENHNLKEKHMKFSVQLQNEEINLPSSVAVSVVFKLIRSNIFFLIKCVICLIHLGTSRIFIKT